MVAIPTTSRRVVAVRSRRIVVAIRAGTEVAKIAQLTASERDGSLYVSFPYLQAQAGQVGHCVLEAGRGYPTDYIVGEGTKITSHLVKYAHHSDGEAHFSQSGRVRTLIRKKATPLNDFEGHIFTIQAQGIDRFEREDQSKRRKSPKDRTVVALEFGPRLPHAVKLVAHLHSVAGLARRSSFATDSPWIVGLGKDGARLASVVLALPTGNSGALRCLVITFEQVPLVNPSQEVFLAFLGGFDPPAITSDNNVDTSFLVALYPFEGDLSDAMQSLGTIDL